MGKKFKFSTNRIDKQLKCNACEKNNAGKCTECGCLIAAKIRTPFQSCPTGRW